MDNQSQAEFLIMKNILYLVQTSKKAVQSQRNLLNKWFQDSIKNYILEQIASPLIAKHLNCSSSAEVKVFIRQNIDKSKPKYMGIIEQYFLNINKYNQGVAFIEKLNQIIQNPQDITQLSNKKSYNINKIARKQFACYLILHLFMSEEQCEFPSFYELWNSCFPNQIQVKKKLSKFDKKEETKKQKRKYVRRLSQKDSLPTSQNELNNSQNTLDLKFEIQNYESSSSLSNQSLLDDNYSDKSHIKLSESNMSLFSKKQINNKIFEENTKEEDLINDYQGDLGSEYIYQKQEDIDYQYYSYQNYYQQEINHQQSICDTQQNQIHYQEQQQLYQQLQEENYDYPPIELSNEQIFINWQQNFNENNYQINNCGYYNQITQCYI
ncbi:hypothetical protein TTHERM_00607250 (macronuclear) [Tetrahymena thermophila SB210]|uniref:Uncharacterized protein n=1 Tax=Tetrahymena thermophila (strain SB210) TaxID=312017 RepID=Q22YG6_TETTS|nr:hypothetical protein TTHERM_00607250 [Tetrahymena thermophila SB210]EAR90319.1 hypothetical protein TTHERM_00607250 [Tetrahymena thermophila SB210]|eukprot:XP_001010564.1 hypothetical protein TTHERM_00607250 [Tetrahymena thermophila SB210]